MARVPNHLRLHPREPQDRLGGLHSHPRCFTNFTNTGHVCRGVDNLSAPLGRLIARPLASVATVDCGPGSFFSQTVNPVFALVLSFWAAIMTSGGNPQHIWTSLWCVFYPRDGRNNPLQALRWVYIRNVPRRFKGGCL